MEALCQRGYGWVIRLIGLTFLCAGTGASAQALANKKVQESAYTSAFADVDKITDQDQDLQDEELGERPPVDLAALRTKQIESKPPDPTPKELLAPVELRSSFPSRVQVGESKNQISWGQVPKGLTSPKPLWKTLKLGECVFTLKTSEFVLNSYYYDKENKLAMADDSVAQMTTFKMQPLGKFYASLSAIIQAENDTKFNDVCRSKLREKRFYLGQANLTGTLLESISFGGERSMAYQEQIGITQKLFLTWSDELGKIEVVNEAGLPPAVESDVFRISMPSAAGMHYLGASTDWAISR